MNKKKNNLGRIIIILIILFLILYSSSSFGYLEYANHQRTILTNEKIKEFEEDLQNNANVDKKKYLDEVQKNYRNNLTNTCTNLSTNFNKYFKFGIEKIFGVLNAIVGES